MPTLDQNQQFEVENKLEQYGGVVCTKLGRATDICHTINMGMSQSLRTCPYRLAPAWKDQLREKVHTLVEAGTLKPSLSPWPPHGTSKETRLSSHQNQTIRQTHH